MSASRTLTALVLASALGLTAACGSDSTPSATDTTSTTAARPCRSFGRTEPASGDATVNRDPAIALLANVQVQASECVDEVSFLFAGGTPGWRVGYAEGPLTEDPSGRPLDVQGAAALVVRMEPASGTDLAAEQAVDVYDGPTSIAPMAPSAIAEVVRAGDFEAVSSWVIGLAERRPFEVVTRGDALVVRLPAPARREVRCALPAAGVTVGAPAGWFVELSDRWACHYFDPHPFTVHPGTDAVDWAVTVSDADVAAAEVVDRMRGGDSDVTVTRSTIGSTPVARLDVRSGGGGLLPAGFHYRMYVLDVGPKALTITSSPSPPDTSADEVDAAAGDFVALVRKAEA